MPNHWETSARPLFVKTVFINGNRHAILFEKDPVLNCGNFPFKKISRSNSSLSFTSDLSTCSSESQETNLESNTFKLRNIEHRQRKDLSSDLQSCLVKLKLASGNLKNKSKTSDEKCLCNSKEVKRSQNTELKKKRHKWVPEKNCKKGFYEENSEDFYEEPKGIELTGRKNSKNSSCYVYNLENNKRKKNYCFVKISSQPQFILNCTCTNKCNHSNKNNLVISATIRNIVMSSGSENLLENTFDYMFENSELHWNYYNSLSERVLQWLDLTRKRKKKETLNLAYIGDSSNITERIFSGKTFANEIKKTEHSCKSNDDISTYKRTEMTLESKTGEEDLDSHMSAEINVKKVVPTKALGVADINFVTGDFLTFGEGESEHYNSQNNNISKDTSIPLYSNFFSKDSATKKLNAPILNLVKSPVKIQDLLLNYNSKENYSFQDQNKIKIKEIQYASTRRNKQKEAENSEEDDSLKATLRSWEKTVKNKSNHVNKSDSYNRQPQCHCNRNLDEYSDNIKSHTLSEEFMEKKQKSINNLNITQTKPLLIQNLLSPQQQSRITYLQEEKIVWASEKNTGRPQLHIFLPTVRLRDQNDDSMSECENFLNT